MVYLIARVLALFNKFNRIIFNDKILLLTIGICILIALINPDVSVLYLLVRMLCIIILFTMIMKIKRQERYFEYFLILTTLFIFLCIMAVVSFL